MKFGKQLRFVAVKGWFDHYIQYKQFKKMIKAYEHRLDEANTQNLSDDQIKALKDEFYETFKEALIANVNDIIKFFSKLCTEATDKIDKLHLDIEHQIQEQEDTEKTEEIAISFHKKVFVNVLNIYEIRTFLAINHTGTHCIVKKFTKKMSYPTCTHELESLADEAFDHQPTIEEQLRMLEECFLTVRRQLYPEGDNRPRQEIILELHKSVENSLLWKQATVVSKWDAYTFRQNEFQLVKAPIKIIPIIVGIVLMLPFMFAPIFKDDDREAQRCLGILVLCAALWATSAVPLWLTSLSIPFFTVIARLIPDSPSHIVSGMIQTGTMSATVFLIIGGFTIAAAFQETEMDKRIAIMVLSKSTSSVRLFIFSVIALNGFLSMWINNVASTMIVVTLVIPILKQLPTNSVFVKLVLLGIAGGGNFGGMTTPLSSPQNAITIQVVENAMEKRGFREEFGFVDFLACAFPPAAVCCLIFWAILLLLFKSDVTVVPKLPPVKTDFGWRQIVVSIITVGTIIIWIVLPFGGETIFGDNGIVGFIPLIAFYGTGILPASKLADLPWNIIFLVMGGNALGKVVDQSGLLSLISGLLQKALGSTSLWVSILIISLFIIVVNIFISHAVAATILLPIICDFALHDPHLRLYAMCACLATTCSQVLPVSSFPNLCVCSLHDRNGNEYLSTLNIIKSGSIATVLSFIVLMSIGYGIQIAYKF